MAGPASDNPTPWTMLNLDLLAPPLNIREREREQERERERDRVCERPLTGVMHAPPPFDASLVILMLTSLKTVYIRFVRRPAPPDPTDGDVLTWSQMKYLRFLAQGQSQRRSVVAVSSQRRHSVAMHNARAR